MPQLIHSHYDNLRVARDAPPEVVRAAYRALVRLYHPDVNPSSDAARVMVILNRAMDVLGDPQRRAAHDQWIAEAETAAWPTSERRATRAVALRPSLPVVARERNRAASAGASAPAQRAREDSAARIEWFAKLATALMMAALAGGLLVGCLD